MLDFIKHILIFVPKINFKIPFKVEKDPSSILCHQLIQKVKKALGSNRKHNKKHSFRYGILINEIAMH